MEDKIDCLLDMIPQESHFYYYFRGCWANGKEGSITDSNGHCVFRFFPLIKDDKGNRIDAEIDFDDYYTNPIVATGIIGYWLHFRKNNDRLASYTTWTKEDERKNTLKIFNDYTEDKLKQYIEREQYSPSSWRRDLEKEFYTDFIIPNEEPLNKQSEALFEYITKDDRKLVEEVIEEYMKYLRKCRSDKGYQVNPELLVLRAVESQDNTKYEDLEDYEVNTILEKLRDEGYIKVSWITGHKPWVTRMLDKGRAYLKKLEEGEIVPPSDKQLDGTPDDDEQNLSSSTEIDDQTDDENIDDWDLFKDWILKDVVIEAIKNIPAGEVTGEVKRHFVIHTVLKEIGWLRHKQATRYVGLMKYHKVVDFAAVDFRDNDLKPFKKIKTIKWGSHLTPGSELGENYRKFADTVRNTFTRNINGKLDDLERFYVKGKIRYNHVPVDDDNKK